MIEINELILKGQEELSKLQYEKTLFKEDLILYLIIHLFKQLIQQEFWISHL